MGGETTPINIKNLQSELSEGTMSTHFWSLLGCCEVLLILHPASPQRG